MSNANVFLVCPSCGVGTPFNLSKAINQRIHDKGLITERVISRCILCQCILLVEIKLESSIHAYREPDMNNGYKINESKKEVTNG